MVYIVHLERKWSQNYLNTYLLHRNFTFPLIHQRQIVTTFMQMSLSVAARKRPVSYELSLGNNPGVSHRILIWQIKGIKC